MLLKRIVRRLRRAASPAVDAIFTLRPKLPLPQGVSEQQLFDFVTSLRVVNTLKMLPNSLAGKIYTICKAATAPMVGTTVTTTVMS